LKDITVEIDVVIWGSEGNTIFGSIRLSEVWVDLLKGFGNEYNGLFGSWVLKKL
jgi:hypothetical protein